MAVKITFNFEDEKLQQKVVTVSNGDSLLEAALDAKIDLQHNCGAVCACSTCHIYVQSGDASLPDISDAEEDFIDRAVNPTIESRLACQCILKDNSELVIKIPNQSHFNGH